MSITWIDYKLINHLVFQVRDGLGNPAKIDGSHPNQPSTVTTSRIKKISREFSENI